MKEIKTIEDMCEVSPVCFETHYERLLKIPDTYHDVFITIESIVGMINEEKNILLSILNVFRYDFQKIDKSTHKMIHDEICSLADKVVHDWLNKWREQRFGT